MNFLDDIADVGSDAWDWVAAKYAAADKAVRENVPGVQAVTDFVQEKAAPVVNFVEKAAPEAKDAWDAGTEWVGDQLAKGPPGSMGRATPEQRTAFEEGAAKIPALAKKKLKEGLTLLDWLTKPWVVAGIAGVVVLAIAEPYVTPFLKRS